MILRRGARHVLTALAMIVPAGCASHKAVDAVKVAPGFGVVSTRQAIAPLIAQGIMPMSDGESTYTLLNDAGQASGSVVFRRTATTEHGATIAAGEDDRRIEFLRRNDDGSIALTAVVERADNALTLFDPPLIVAPAKLEPGRPFVSESAMRVLARDQPRKQREHGTARRSIEYTTDVLIETPDGDVEAARLDIHFTADLQLADAEERSSMYVSRDAGRLVALVSVEQVKILGVIRRHSQRTLIRLK
jgi:hypothetical protein